MVLRDHGGVFTDIDVEFVRSFEHMVATELPHRTTFFAGLRREPDEVTMLEVTPLCILPAVWHPLLLLGYRLQFPVSSTLFLLSHSHDAVAQVAVLGAAPGAPPPDGRAEALPAVQPPRHV